MLIWLIVKMLLLGGFLTLAAHCAERLCTIKAFRRRWIWTSALVLTIVPSIILLPNIHFQSSPPSAIQPSLPPLASAEQRERTRLSIRAFEDRTIVRQMSPPIITFAGHRIVVIPDIDLALGWGALSVMAALFLVVVYLQFRRIRRRWPIATLQGVRVRIAPDGSPVVIGFLHPEIVIPQWLLGCSADEQRAVLAHEQEHIRAKDHWILAGACGLLALFPWCPWVWWMVSRLRLVIELDCDARVLQQGVAPQTYGSLLIDVAERGSGLPVQMLALVDPGSHLKRRLRALGPHRLPFAAPMQIILFGAVTLFALPVGLTAFIPAPAETETAGPTVNGVIDITPEQKFAQLRAKALRTRDSLGLWSYITDGRELQGEGLGSEIHFLGAQLEFKQESALRWIDFFTDPIERGRLRDSILVLVNGTRLGMFPVHDLLPLRQLDKKFVIEEFRQTTAPWAVHAYGADAAHGVVNIIAGTYVTQGDTISR